MSAEPLAPATERAVERLGQSLELDGIPRMPARVFAFVLTSREEASTSREIAEGLQVSAAAVSGAVRYLHENRLIVRERTPRSRGERYRLAGGDIWTTIMRARQPLMEEIVRGIDDAVALLVDEAGAEHPGVTRLRETREFFAFVQTELVGVMERWADRREPGGSPG